MRHAHTFAIAAAGERRPIHLFQSLVVTAPGQAAARRGATFAASLALHSSFALALAVVPVLLRSPLPAANTDTIFTDPVQITLAPPPPAAPPGDGAPLVRRATRPPTTSSAMITPAEIQNQIRPEDLFDSLPAGHGTGVVGGVGDDPGGSVGSILGDDFTLVSAPPPPPPVRISQRSQPRLLDRIEPRYPVLAVSAGLSATVEVEAEVDASGYVRTAKVLHGHPLFDEEALAAVRQWRYQPLLLNGEPTAFILTVRVDFRIHRQ